MTSSNLSKDIGMPDLLIGRGVIGTPQAIAEIAGGVWDGIPNSRIDAIRHRSDLIEDSLGNFLFVPELFSLAGGTAARAALLTSKKALAKGAAGIIASARPRNITPDVPCLLVPDVRAAIARLAEHSRRLSKAKFFAVTGSIGKSTTRNMIHLLASSVGPANRSTANYNAGIESIHFTLSNLAPTDEFCVAEFSEVGDLNRQVQFYRPHVSIITNILWEHSNRIERQNYAGVEILRRLAYLAAGVARHMQPGGICILNADEDNFRMLAEEVSKIPGVRIKTFGRGRDADVQILTMSHDAESSQISLRVEDKEYHYCLGIAGAHMAINSVAAAAAAHYAGIPIGPALPLFETFKTEFYRGAYITVPWEGGHVTLRNETVSSNLPGLRSTLNQLGLEQPGPGGRRVAVLGQVNGLGSSMVREMTALGREMDGAPVDRFYTIGSDIRIFNEAIMDRSRVAPHFQTLEQLEAALRKELRAGDLVVFKASRVPEAISLRILLKNLMGDASFDSDPDTIQDIIPEPARRVVIGGDTYLGESYQEKREKSADINYLTTFGYDYSGERLAPLLQRADFTIVNLECALTHQKSSDLEGRKDYILRGRPRETVAALKRLNIGGVLLGNNHSMDYLAGGLHDMLDSMALAGISVSGAGRNRNAAQMPILNEFDVDGVSFRLAVISGYEYNDTYEKFGFYAGPEKSGVNNINIDRLKAQIASLRKEGYFVIVSPHWGANYCFRTYAQGNLARRIVGAGADLVLGHGPHMMNEISQINGVWVIYSLGNLIFNSEGEYDARGVQPYSFIAELELARAGRALEAHLNLYPIVSCNQMTQFQPEFVDEYQFNQVVSMLGAMHYDQHRLFSDISRRQLDGRHCMTIQLF
jgi:UDP-N-acetylmuramyl pentapeptide synthase